MYMNACDILRLKGELYMALYCNFKSWDVWLLSSPIRHLNVQLQVWYTKQTLGEGLSIDSDLTNAYGQHTL